MGDTYSIYIVGRRVTVLEKYGSGNSMNDGSSGKREEIHMTHFIKRYASRTASTVEAIDDENLLRV